MPYKKDVKKYVNFFNETAKLSGSVNLIVKHKKKYMVLIQIFLVF